MPKKLGNTTYYSTSELSTIINRNYDTALRRIEENDIKAVKINSGYLVEHSELVRYLDEVEALPESIIDLRLGKTKPGKKKVASIS